MARNSVRIDVKLAIPPLSSVYRFPSASPAPPSWLNRRTNYPVCIIRTLHKTVQVELTGKPKVYAWDYLPVAIASALAESAGAPTGPTKQGVVFETNSTTREDDRPARVKPPKSMDFEPRSWNGERHALVAAAPAAGGHAHPLRRLQPGALPAEGRPGGLQPAGLRVARSALAAA